MANDQTGFRQWVMEATTAQTIGFPPAPAHIEPFSAGPQFLPSFDAIELLPPAAAAKLQALRQRAADAHALSVPFEDVRTASMTRISAEQALKRLTDHPQEGGFGLPQDHASVVAATKTFEKATADFKRLTELQEARDVQWQAVSQATAACENWLKNGRPGGTALEVMEVEPPKLAKGEGILDGIERHRRRVRELKADLHRISSSPFPSSYCKQRAREQVEQLAQRGAISVSLLVEHDGDIQFPEMQVTSTVYNVGGGAVAHHQAIDVAALIAFLHKPVLIAALDREITTESDDKAALSHEARQKAEAQIMGDLLSVERDESWLVWQAQSQNLPVEHRADCNPLAILQIRLITAPRSSNGHTSPDHAINFALPGKQR